VKRAAVLQYVLRAEELGEKGGMSADVFVELMKMMAPGWCQYRIEDKKVGGQRKPAEEVTGQEDETNNKENGTGGWLRYCRNAAFSFFCFFFSRRTEGNKRQKKEKENKKTVPTPQIQNVQNKTKTKTKEKKGRREKKK
jgi:hypothetical protein